ncbi:MAG: hypothetical protein A2904_00215 [Candidatus Staskawiczbacteria bacterium RIFCSPLOWO2_01_FULL_33_9]|uniref:PKD domain-containing protein n=1 Tax=Candidatus Staskawiczbacteria bacterium RIFCSPLOWO2_01_FULL_33_9 TaxID=1802211 RepID=A0A1G2I5W0_9BACT|nr:MAG: hypothetical protein A2904_00215 [Candidatus Staskawiczbacteria bacterium RIFCSPLOWO2_01_FULL_33_9]
MGFDQCQNMTDCANTHNVCNAQQQCVVVDGLGTDECQDNNGCVITNDPPYADQLASGPGSPCTGIQGTGIAYFQWRYQDTEGDTEKKFILQIDDNSDFSSPEVERSFDNLSYPAGTLNQQVVLVKTIPTTPYGDYIKYNVDYYWRVMVEQNAPILSSNWIVATQTFIMTGHPSPSSEFTYTPFNPAPGTLINFTDLSICYSNSGPYSCKSTNPITSAPNGYTWNFGDGSPNSTTVGDVTHTYNSTQPSYTAGLTVCDEVNCCIIEHPIPVRIPGSGLPNWKEVSPF